MWREEEEETRYKKREGGGELREGETKQTRLCVIPLQLGTRSERKTGRPFPGGLPPQVSY